MKTLTLNTRFQSNTTTVENAFIDRYMAEANGEYVKVYLLLLRYLGRLGTAMSISGFADLLDNTEKDILRALSYWEKAGLITLQHDAAGSLCGITLEQVPSLDDSSEIRVSVSSASDRPENSAAPAIPDAAQPEILPEASSENRTLSDEALPVRSYSQDAASRIELKSILFVAEQYMGKTLTRSEVDTILYFYENLGFSTDLIEYLIEYCADNGHRSIHYIRQVALAWYKDEITTVDQARDRTSFHNKNCYAVLKAFGISGRNAAAAELEYIQRWTNEYGFTLDMVVEACNRTMSSIHQPSFEYADTILKSWLTKNIHHLSDLEQADLDFQKTREQKKTRPAVTQNRQSAPANRFNNFQRRNYDLDSLEQQLLKNR